MTKGETELAEVIHHNLDAAERIAPVFRDRTEAGELLARELSQRRYPNPVVIAIPHGGIPVALPIAKTFKIPIHLLPVAKIPCSRVDTRFGIGAVTASGTLFLNIDLLQEFNINEGDIDQGTTAAADDAKRKSEGLSPLAAALPSDLRDKTVIVVDDGIASGATVMAALTDLKPRSPTKIVVAAAVCSPKGRAVLTGEPVELMVGHQATGPAFLLDNFFANFDQLSLVDAQRLMQITSL